jgi:hypothetical protein
MRDDTHLRPNVGAIPEIGVSFYDNGAARTSNSIKVIISIAGVDYILGNRRGSMRKVVGCSQFLLTSLFTALNATPPSIEG